MVHKAWNSIEDVPFCFPRSTIKLQGHKGEKNRKFWPELSVSGLQLQFEFTDRFDMIHKAWRTGSIEEVSYCFSRSSIKFQGHTGWKIDDFNPIPARLLGRSQLSNPSDLPCYRLGCCPCPIQWGWQHQAMLNTCSPCVYVSASQATFPEISLDILRPWLSRPSFPSWVRKR